MLKKVLLIIIALILSLIVILFTVHPVDKKCKDTTVVFWTLQLNTFDKYINGIITEFEKENPDIKIQWVDVPYSEGEKRVLASLLSNSTPDLINITADFAKTLAQKGALEPVFAEYVTDFNPQIMETLKYEIDYTSFPFYATSAVTIYNKELAEKAGLKSPPRTYDELNKITPDFKKKTGAYAQMPTLCENDTFLKILNKHGINSPETLNTNYAIEIFNTYKGFYQKDYIPSESITQTHREVLEKYGSGQIGFLQAGPNFLNLIKENSPNVYAKTSVALQLTAESGLYDFSLMNLAIPKKAKNQKAARKFALFLLNKENQLAFAKLTPILPVNQAALEDSYFTSMDKYDLVAEARIISASQLNKVQPPVHFTRNQKEILNLLNITTQEILLDKMPTDKALEKAAQKWADFEE